MAGALAAGLLSGGLIAVFSGHGLLSAPPTSAHFPAAVAIGAIGWLALATRAGLPVSTTHALVGGLVGAGIAAQSGAGVSWAVVAGKVALPLALSPLLALGLVFSAFPLVRGLFRRLDRYCVCLERRELLLVTARGEAQLASERGLHVLAGVDCPPQVMTRVGALESLHWLSAGLTSFARGLNDAPKILALGLTSAPLVGLGTGQLIVVVGLAMGLGSFLAGRRVTETLAGKVTRISPDDGLAANLVTSALVGLASFMAAPVSTTHVSTGAIVGIGLHGHQVRWKLVRELLLAWLVTLPAGAALAAGAYLLLGG
jgi:PiT family inorganic phosphate transporter